MTWQVGQDGRRGRYLRHNDTSWTPASVIFIDSEARRAERGGGEDQTLRLWCTQLVDRRDPRRGQRERLAVAGTTGLELATTVDGWTTRRRNTWLYSHNIGYDLTLCDLVPQLCALGWSVSYTSSTPDYLFLTLAKGERSLTVTDSHHLWPAPLEQIGSWAGVHKGRMPADGAPEEDWAAYCARDVAVLATAVLQVMSHWDDLQLGRWSVTGASCGWRAMRHMTAPKTITLFDDPEGSALDRAAIYGGRRYCWRWGDQPPGRYTEIDFTQAHATVAASYPLPCKRGPWVETLDPHHKVVDGIYGYLIAECEVETDVPRFPQRANGKVWYPVGRFTTVLASPEIAWARDLGCLRRIGRGQIHYHTTGLQPFFQRVLDMSGASDDGVPPAAKAMWKQWGRSVAGKFAQAGWQLRDTGMLTDQDWRYERSVDAQSGQARWLIHYGGTVKEAWEEGDGANAYPAVLAVIESYERVATGKAAEALGSHVTISCDTDGIWADAGALEAGVETGLGFNLGEVDRRIRVQLAVDCVSQLTGALQPREKTTVARMTLAGPQNYTAGPRQVQSGRPRKAVEVRPGVWAGDTFPSVAIQQQREEAGVYRVESVTWSVPVCAVPAWVVADRTTRAVQTHVDGGGQVVLTPWPLTRWAKAGLRLAPAQNPDLAGLWDPATDCEETRDGKESIWDRSADDARAVVAARRRAAGLPPARKGVPAMQQGERVSAVDVFGRVLADPWGNGGGEHAERAPPGH